MDKLHNLFIRACKSQDSMTRLKTLHKRYFLVVDDKSTIDCLVYWLSTIVDLYSPITISQYLKEYAEQESYFKICNESYTNQDVILQVLRSHLCRIIKEDLEKHGYVKPLRWRNK